MNFFCSERKAENIDMSFYSGFGQKYLGPFLYAYTFWLYKEITASGIRKVFFLARDGYLMEKAFQLFLKEKRGNLEVQYVYFSRKSIRQTMLWKCNSYQESLKYMSTSRFISMGGILEYWGFSGEERQEIGRQYNLSLTEEFPVNGLATNTKLDSLYAKLKERIGMKSREQDTLFRRYIEQIGMRDRCAIVDIGWHGRMQQYIEQYFEYNGIPLICSGFYLGIQTVVPVRGTARGFLYDNEHPGLRKDVLVFLGVYEKLFQSFEGSTYGYQEQDGAISPVLGSYEYEGQPESQEKIRTWQDAALHFLQEALGKELPAGMSRALPLVRMGKYPKLKDVRLFSFLYNDDGKKNYFVSQKSLWQYKPKELVHALSNSAWKTGFMRSVFKLPLPYYYIYYLIRK